MLEVYDQKEVRIRTVDGEIFDGTADFCPSGYGLHEFGRQEESVCIGDTQLFSSDIQTIELREQPDAAPSAEELDAMCGELLDGPYRILDPFPMQVPGDGDGQYFAVERYFMQPAQRTPLYRRFAQILLRLNCYYRMSVTFDGCETWETNPDPETFAAQVESLPQNQFVRAIFAGPHVMIDLEGDETGMTVYDPEGNMTGLLQCFALANGLFLWQPPQA